jgi:hypothetical protein
MNRAGKDEWLLLEKRTDERGEEQTPLLLNLKLGDLLREEAEAKRRQISRLRKRLVKSPEEKSNVYLYSHWHQICYGNQTNSYTAHTVSLIATTISVMTADAIPTPIHDISNCTYLTEDESLLVLACRSGTRFYPAEVVCFDFAGEAFKGKVAFPAKKLCSEGRVGATLVKYMLWNLLKINFLGSRATYVRI